MRALKRTSRTLDNAFPIFDAEGRCKYVLHRSTIVNSLLPLAPDATLADAKDLLDKNPQCLDILVTQDGTKNGTVVGWITNVMVLNAATI